ncbi:hypothetical protein NPX13_g1898 [Xylaria arbuscula]|uniref:Major facilitator superfamily (MFS) profile domain-containing protein n=1 Tax=Xylaria arbuscula TaxID=114810 RepID=A0A9W8TRI4_9PEZI|nr:hypothetical protein NPX13_g1898 [Xylaria arbuscula]
MESIPEPVLGIKPKLSLANVDTKPCELEKGLLSSSPISSSEVIVDWEGPDDPANPLNWTSARKTFVIAVVSAVTFNVSLVPTIFAPGVPLLLKEFHSESTALASFAVSAYIIPFAISPLVVAPLSEIYGRNVVMNTANFAFLVFTIVCAISNSIALFLVFRVLQGGAACVPLVLGGGMIGDLVVPEKRGRALSGWQLGPLLGPVIGPVVGGYIAQNVGWRWLFWLIAILSGVLTLLYLLIPETYHLTLLARKAARLQKNDGSRTYIAARSARITPAELLRKSILAVAYGYSYLLFTTFVFVFEGQYQFSSGEAGLSYLGLGVGFLLGLLTNALTSDYIAQKEAKDGEIKPESRLAPLLIGALIIPAGLIWYGWTAEYHVHWIVPIIGTSLIGIGVNLIWMPIQGYLIDAFTIYAASAIAANTVVRSIFGVVLPLAGQPLYDKLGLGWGNTLLAFIALATAPLTWLIMKYGERIRLNPRFQLEL